MTDRQDENAGEIPLSWFGKTLWKFTPLYLELIFLAVCLRLTLRLFAQVNADLAYKGVALRSGTLVNAMISKRRPRRRARPKPAIAKCRQQRTARAGILA